MVKSLSVGKMMQSHPLQMGVEWGAHKGLFELHRSGCKAEGPQSCGVQVIADGNDGSLQLLGLLLVL